ncbi:MAG: hypothetical protein QOE36_504 [Gaiellaceae bacterium]|jgi:hypothetical protein|nr:hypothetical protein [Gaiellaceae bacterium]
MMVHPYFVEAEAADRRNRLQALAASSRAIRSDLPERVQRNVTIRPARASDGTALDELVQLNEAPLGSDALVGEIDGRIVAALDLESGLTLSDPFLATADVTSLLALRARQLRPSRRGISWRRRYALRPVWAR